MSGWGQQQQKYCSESCQADIQFCSSYWRGQVAGNKTQPCRPTRSTNATLLTAYHIVQDILQLPEHPVLLHLGFLQASTRLCPLIPICPRYHQLKELGSPAPSVTRERRQWMAITRGKKSSATSQGSRIIQPTESACFCKLIPLSRKDTVTAEKPVGNTHGHLSPCPPSTHFPSASTTAVSE